jgi:hypothetical protein
MDSVMFDLCRGPGTVTQVVCSRSLARAHTTQKDVSGTIFCWGPPKASSAAPCRPCRSSAAGGLGGPPPYYAHAACARARAHVYSRHVCCSWCAGAAAAAHHQHHRRRASRSRELTLPRCCHAPPARSPRIALADDRLARSAPLGVCLVSELTRKDRGSPTALRRPRRETFDQIQTKKQTDPP